MREEFVYSVVVSNRVYVRGKCYTHTPCTNAPMLSPFVLLLVGGLFYGAITANDHSHTYTLTKVFFLQYFIPVHFST